MSQARASIIDFLNSGFFKKHCWTVDHVDEKFTICMQPSPDSDLKALLKGDAKEQINMISERDPKTKENAFHYLLQKSFIKFPDDNPVWVARPESAASLRLWLLGQLILRENDVYRYSLEGHLEIKRKNQSIQITETSRYACTYSHREALKYMVEETIANRFNDRNTKLFLETLLTPFKHEDKDDKSNKEKDRQLKNLLIQLDNKGLSSLHYAYNPPFKNNEIDLLLARIKQMDPAYKMEMATTKDLQGNTVFHYIAQYAKKSDIAAAVDAFGETAAQVALAAPNSNQMTSLHTILTLPNQLGNLEPVCKIIRGEEKKAGEQKSYVSSVFNQDSNGFNPLHLACKLTNVNQSLNAITTLKTILSPDLFLKKIQERDKKGITPINHAMNNKNYDAVLELMRMDSQHINKQQQQNIFRGQFLLHTFCSNLDQKKLGETVQAYGENYKVFIFEKDTRGRLPLHYALKSAHADTINTILEHPMLDAKDRLQMLLTVDKKGLTPFHLACRRCDVSIIESLINPLKPEERYLLLKVSNKPFGVSKKSLMSNHDLSRIIDGMKDNWFELVDYFIQNKQRFYKKDDKDFQARIGKAKEYFQNAEQKQAVSPAAEFKKKYIGSERFYKLSSKLDLDSPATSCRDFFLNLENNPEAMSILNLSKQDCQHLKSLWTTQASAPSLSSPSDPGETEPGSTYPKLS